MIRTKTMHVTRLLPACLILLCGDLTLAHSQTTQSTAEAPAATPADAVPTAALPVDTTDRPAAQPGPADAHVSRLEDSAPPAASPAPSGDNDAYKLETGDRLKISIYGREDLTAEYRVNDQGQIRIPTLGAFDAAKRMPSELEEAIRQGLERILQRPGNVAVDVIERQPIFVTGLVAKPGAYRFTSGMAVIHATVLAGGTASNGDSLPTEALRERSKIRGARADMKHLIARRARLLAERDGKDEIATPPELVKLAGNGAAEEVINVEKEALKHQREVRDRQRTALEASIKENKVELDAYEKELANIGEQRRLRQVTLDRLKSLSDKGLTTQQRLTDSEIMLTSVDRDAQYAIANISRSRQTLARAERDLAMLSLERNEAIGKELQDIDQQLEKQREIINVADRVINRISGMPSGLLTQEQDPELHFVLLRKSDDGELHTIAATETTRLQPGDVLRVSAKETGKEGQ